MQRNVVFCIACLVASCNQASVERAMPAPPEVKGEAEGFLLTYFDDTGVHTAMKRSDVPAAARQYVRIQSLGSPSKTPAGSVFVADMREAAPDGSYPVFTMERAQLEALIDKTTGAAPVAAQTQKPQIVLYGASWCGACRSAIDYLNKRGIAFEQHDIEKEPEARAEMNRKLKAAGRAGAGIPVIDVRGKILTGFNPTALSAAIDSTSKP